MNEVILQKLQEIERSENVRILYACESGSRAWGFASPDSDYDVRFIYAHNVDHYLSIDSKRDVIELPVNEVLDISGWDVKKALLLFRKTNAALFEWLQSPIVYKSEVDFHISLLAISQEYFNPIAGFHHYINMATTCFQNDLQSDQVKLKKYFYALRPVLAAKWIIDQKSCPPMEFHLLRATIENDVLQKEIDLLLEEKQVSNEKTLIEPKTILNQFIEQTIDYCNRKKEELKDSPSSSEALNLIFREALGATHEP